MTTPSPVPPPSTQEGQLLGQGAGAGVLCADSPFPHLCASAFPSLHAEWPALGGACAHSPNPCPHTHTLGCAVATCFVQVQHGLPQVSFRSPCSMYLEYQQLLSPPFPRCLVITGITFCLPLQQCGQGRVPLPQAMYPPCTPPPVPGTAPGTRHMFRK